MKLTFLDSLVKRLVFSIALASVIVVLSYFFYDARSINIMAICIIGVLVYIPVTLFYAIASTFFVKDELKDEDEILDAS